MEIVPKLDPNALRSRRRRGPRESTAEFSRTVMLEDLPSFRDCREPGSYKDMRFRVCQVPAVDHNVARLHTGARRGKNPVAARTVDVLPAPLDPNKATTPPDASSRLTFSTPTAPLP